MKVRNLETTEITRMIENGCMATDWSLVEVEDGFNPDNLHGVSFRGRVVLAADVTIRGASLQNVTVEPGVTIDGSVVIENEPDAGFGYPVRIRPGNESMTPLRIEPGSRLEKIGERFCGWSPAVPFPVIGAETVIKGAGYIRNTSIGKKCLLTGHFHIEDSAIHPNVDVRSPSLVTGSCIGPGCKLESGAVVSSSLLLPAAGAVCGAVIKESLIGQGTVVEQAEVTASLVGPSTGIHHKSLVIAVSQPLGRGNFGAGSLVGSNHTGKAPDQAALLGEGVFWGIGVNAKYPLDLREASYLLAASGITMLPQKVRFPFSLINSPSRTVEGLSPAYNEIFPGWVIGPGAYILARNEWKFRDRESGIVEFLSCFRQKLCDEVVQALELLGGLRGKQVYTDADEPGLGKNFLLEESRRSALEYYELFLNVAACVGENRGDRVELPDGYPTSERESVLEEFLDRVIEGKDRDRRRQEKILGLRDDADDREEMVEFVRGLFGLGSGG